MTLHITRDSPGYVRRARHVVRQELCIDITDLPDAEWIPILLAACNHAHSTRFRAMVLEAAIAVIERRYAHIGYGP